MSTRPFPRHLRLILLRASNSISKTVNSAHPIIVPLSHLVSACLGCLHKGSIKKHCQNRHCPWWTGAQFFHYASPNVCLKFCSWIYCTRKICSLGELPRGSSVPLNDTGCALPLSLTFALLFRMLYRLIVQPFSSRFPHLPSPLETSASGMYKTDSQTSCPKTPELWISLWDRTQRVFAKWRF